MSLAVTSTLPPEDVGVEAPSFFIQDCLNKCNRYFLVGDTVLLVLSF